MLQKLTRSATVNRRTATAMLGGAALLPESAYAQSSAPEATDVIILGGGLAGLQAGLTLMESGARLIVLEGTSRIGGRVYTARDAPLQPEYGASQIGRSYARIIELCRRFDLKLVPEDRTVLPMSNLIGDKWVRSGDWQSSNVNKMVGDERAFQPAMVGSNIMNKYNRLLTLEDWLNPEFADLDISLRQLLIRHGHSPEAMRLANISTTGNDYDSASMLALMQESTRQRFDLSFSDAKETGEVYGFQENNKKPGELATINNIERGSDALTDAMAAALGDRVRTGQMVSRIDMDSKGGEITCANGQRYRGRFIISAMPFSALRKVAITPELPPRQREAVNEMDYGYTTRGFGTIDRRYWEDDQLEPSFFTDGAIKMFWALKPRAGEDIHRFMLVFTGAAAARIDRMNPADARAFSARELARIRPSMAGHTQLNAWYSWGQDPMIQGCRHIFAPGQVTRFAREMILPHQALHFAGEHTRRYDFGMESAVESGERSAFEIIERMG